MHNCLQAGTRDHRAAPRELSTAKCVWLWPTFRALARIPGSGAHLVTVTAGRVASAPGCASPARYGPVGVREATRHSRSKRYLHVICARAEFWPRLGKEGLLDLGGLGIAAARQVLLAVAWADWRSSIMWLAVGAGAPAIRKDSLRAIAVTSTGSYRRTAGHTPLAGTGGGGSDRCPRAPR